MIYEKTLNCYPDKEAKRRHCIMEEINDPVNDYGSSLISDENGRFIQLIIALRLNQTYIFLLSLSPFRSWC